MLESLLGSEVRLVRELEDKLRSLIEPLKSSMDCMEEQAASVTD